MFEWPLLSDEIANHPGQGAFRTQKLRNVWRKVVLLLA